jgi:hypothetical protein
MPDKKVLGSTRLFAQGCETDSQEGRRHETQEHSEVDA